MTVNEAINSIGSIATAIGVLIGMFQWLGTRKKELAQEQLKIHQKLIESFSRIADHTVFTDNSQFAANMVATARSKGLSTGDITNVFADAMIRAGVFRSLRVTPGNAYSSAMRYLAEVCPISKAYLERGIRETSGAKD